MKISDEEKKKLDHARDMVLDALIRNAKAGDREGIDQTTKAYTSLVMTTAYLEQVK